MTKYVYDGDQCIAEYDGNGELLRKYIYGPGIDQPICMVDVNDSNAVYYYHFDALASVVALSDADGDTVQVYEYSVYGQVAASDPNHTNPFLFTGRRFDSETGLYYYRARYYNPYIGRFLQTDPIGYGDGTNIYAYCGNNPVGFVDPSGEVRVWRWIDGKLVDSWHPPFINLPEEWREYANYELGIPKTWKRANFWYHYRHGRGVTVDLARIGLLEKFKGDEIVAGLRNKWIEEAKRNARESWEEIDAECSEWEARLLAGEWPLPPYPTDMLEYSYNDEGEYNFEKAKYWPDLYVLGHGRLRVFVKIRVMRFVFGGGQLDYYFYFSFEDWFIDVLDPLNYWPDDVYGMWDYDDCTPFKMIGGWSERLSEQL